MKDTLNKRIWLIFIVAVVFWICFLVWGTVTNLEQNPESKQTAEISQTKIAQSFP